MKKVLLCGNSILIAGLAISLQGVEGLDVACADFDSLPDVQSFAPNVVVLDLNDAQAARAVAHFCAQPGLLVLGVDAARSVLTVLSGSQMTVTDTADLAQLVKRFVQGETEKRDGAPYSHRPMESRA